MADKDPLSRTRGVARTERPWIMVPFSRCSVRLFSRFVRTLYQGCQMSAANARVYLQLITTRHFQVLCSPIVECYVISQVRFKSIKVAVSVEGGSSSLPGRHCIFLIILSQSSNACILCSGLKCKICRKVALPPLAYYISEQKRSVKPNRVHILWVSLIIFDYWWVNTIVGVSVVFTSS